MPEHQNPTMYNYRRIVVWVVVLNFLFLFNAFSWQPVTNGLPVNANITRLASDGSKLAVLSTSSGSPNGVYVSTNGGFSWSKAAALTGSGTQAGNLLVFSNIIYAARSGQTVGTNAILYSTNYGASWLPGLNIPNSTAVTNLATDGASLFVNANGSGNVWRSTNAGASWELVATAAGNFNNGNVLSLGGHDGHMVAATSQGMFTLTDTGTNWTKINSEVNIFNGTRMAWQTDRLFMLNNQVNRRALALLDGGTNLFNATNGLTEAAFGTTYRELTAGSGAVFASAQFLIGGPFLFGTVDGGTNWNNIPLPTGASTIAAIEVVSNNLFAAVTFSPQGLFRVVLSNGVPVFAPTITTNPVSSYVPPGVNVTFTAGATSSVPMNLQWRKDGVDIFGETNLALMLPNVTTNNNGSYSLVTWNLGGTNFSTAATLGVITPAPGHVNFNFNAGAFGYDLGVLTNNSGNVICVEALTNNQILIAGTFTHVNMILNPDATVSGGVRSQKIARLNPDGSADSSFQTFPGFGLNDSVSVMAIGPDGKIYVGGQLSTYNGILVTNLVRLNSDGSLDTEFTPDFEPLNSFKSGQKQIQPLSDGHVLISGTFTSVSGVARTNVVCLKSDGTVDPTWFASGGLLNGSTVQSFATNDIGDVLVGGFFTSIDGVSRRYLVALGTNGVLDTNFNHTLDNGINELNHQPGGLVWARGSFTKYTNGVAITVTQPVRLYSDGLVVSSSPTNLASGTPMFSQADGRMIMAFYASALGSYQMLRFNADSSLDEDFETMGGFNSLISDLAMTPNGNLFVAGYFSTAAGVPTPGSLACLYGAETNVTPNTAIFTLTPTDAVVVSNANITLRTAVVGTAPISFQWLRDALPLTGETNLILNLTNFLPVNAGAYQLVASNGFGAVTSAVANINLAAAPAITVQPPASLGTTNGGSVTLSVGVNGSAPLRFQWQKDGFAQFGLTNNPYVISNLTAGLTGNWRLVVSNLYGRATSDVVNVQIGTPPSFFSAPGNQTLNGLGDVSMQAIAGGSSSFPLIFRWYQNSELVFTWVTNNNLGSKYVISNAVPTNGGMYQVVISNFVGSVTSAPFTVTIKNPYLAVNPQSRSVVEGGMTNLSTIATGTDPIYYFWYRRYFSPNATNLVAGGTSTNLSFVNAQRSDTGSYFVVASNVWGTSTSSLASLTVNFQPAVTNIYPGTNIITETGGSTYFFIQYEASPTPALYWFKDGVPQPSLTGFSTLNFSPAQTNQSGTYQVIVSNYVGSTTSTPIVLTVKPPRAPTITNQPSNRVLKVGDTLYLTAGADGSPMLYYGLFKEGGAQFGSWTTSPQAGGPVTSTNQSGNYYLVVTNHYGSATSELASVSILQPQPASFNGKQFIKIADSFTVIPGLSPTQYFGSFRDAFLRGSDVWFGGSVSGVPFSVGVYHWSGGVISKLVDTNSLVPGSASRFTNFYGSTFLSDNKVVFVGNGSGEEHGLYAWTNNAIIKLYDTTTLMPGRSDNFSRFGWPSVVGNQFAFLGFSKQNPDNYVDYRAVYLSSNGVLSVLADTNTPLPNVGGTFRGSSSQVAFDGTNVSWWAWNADDIGGIFRVSSGTLTSLADQLTANPATAQNFNGFISPPTIYSGRTYLVGHDPSFKTTLFYRDIGGPLTVVSKPGDTIPSRGNTFDSLGYPAQTSSSAGVFFDGTEGAGYHGIFYWNGSTTVKVIDTLDTLDGQAISYVYVADADADNLLFYVNFTNGKIALYAMTDAGQSFNNWLSNYTFPPGQSDPEDDADGDGILNVFEYYFGSNPTDSGSGNQPTVSSVNVGGVDYPAITFIRSKNVSGVTLLPQASTDVNFTDSLGTTVESVVDLGNGTEQVTIRSSVAMNAQSMQFLRIRLSLP